MSEVFVACVTLETRWRMAVPQTAVVLDLARNAALVICCPDQMSHHHSIPKSSSHDDLVLPLACHCTSIGFCQ